MDGNAEDGASAEIDSNGPSAMSSDADSSGNSTPKDQEVKEAPPTPPPEKTKKSPRAKKRGSTPEAAKSKKNRKRKADTLTNGEVETSEVTPPKKAGKKRASKAPGVTPAKPQKAKPKSPKTAEAKSPKSRQPLESKSPRPELIESKSPKPKPLNSKSPKPKLVESKSPKSKLIESKSPKAKLRESKSPKSKLIESKSPKAKLHESKSPKAKSQESKSPKAKLSEPKSPIICKSPASSSKPLNDDHVDKEASVTQTEAVNGSSESPAQPIIPPPLCAVTLDQPTGLIGVPQLGRPEDLKDDDDDDDEDGEGRPYQCGECSYKARKKGQLRKHMAVHNVFQCAHCEYSSKIRDDLQSHMQEQHPNRCGRKLCKKCNVLFLAMNLDEHEKECTGEKKGWTCPHCHKEFKFVCVLKTHIQRWHTEEGAKRFGCKQCEFRAVCQKDLTAHVHAEHKEPELKPPKTIKCPECDIEFDDEALVREHVKEQHIHERPYICELCQKAFKTKTHLKNHYETHNPSDTYKCEVEGCASTFKAAKYYERHRVEVHKLPARRHRTVYACPHDGCAEVFQRKSHLQRHEISHTGEKKFKCDWPDCGRLFSHLDNLQKHYKGHTHEKPYKCELCENAYNQRSGLKYHMLKSHGVPLQTQKQKKEDEAKAAELAQSQGEEAGKVDAKASEKAEESECKGSTEGDSSGKDVYDFNDSDDDSIDLKIRQIPSVKSPRRTEVPEVAKKTPSPVKSKTAAKKKKPKKSEEEKAETKAKTKRKAEKAEPEEAPKKSKKKKGKKQETDESKNKKKGKKAAKKSKKKKVVQKKKEPEEQVLMDVDDADDDDEEEEAAVMVAAGMLEKTPEPLPVTEVPTPMEDAVRSEKSPEPPPAVAVDELAQPESEAEPEPQADAEEPLVEEPQPSPAPSSSASESATEDRCQNFADDAYEMPRAPRPPPMPSDEEDEEEALPAQEPPPPHELPSQTPQHSLPEDTNPPSSAPMSSEPSDRPSMDYMQTPLSEPYSVPPPSYGERRSSYSNDMMSPTNKPPDQYSYPDSTPSYQAPGSYVPPQVGVPGSVEAPSTEAIHSNLPSTEPYADTPAEPASFHPPSVSQPETNEVPFSSPLPVASTDSNPYSQNSAPTYLPSSPAVTNAAVSSAPSTFGSDSFPNRDFFGQYFQDPNTLPLSHQPQDQRSLPGYQQQAGLSALQRTNADFLRTASLMPGATYPSVTESFIGMTPSALHQPPSQPSWPGMDDRSRHWTQPNPLIMSSDIESNAARNPYANDYSSFEQKRPESAFPGSQPSSNELAYRGFNTNYRPPQKPFDDMYRSISDYRSLPQPMTDVYSRMGAMAAAGLDKYYYPRDMYRPHLPSAPFMPSTSSHQMTPYAEREYPRNPPMYPQPTHGAYGFIADKQYLGGANKVPQAPMPSTPSVRGPDYLQTPSAAGPQDPYRSSLIHYNMMQRYF